MSGTVYVQCRQCGETFPVPVGAVVVTDKGPVAVVDATETADIMLHQWTHQQDGTQHGDT